MSGTAMVLLCVALDAPVFAFASRSTHVVVVRKDSSGSSTATCPTGEHVAFGGLIAQFQPPPNVPSHPTVFPESMRRTAPNRWTVSGQSGTNGTGSRLTSVAYCSRGKLPGAALQTVRLPAGATASATATCPTGTVVVGGGFNTGASSRQMELVAELARVSSTQWRATMHNGSRHATTITALAYCATGAAPTMFSTTVSLTSRSGGVARASCPNPMSLVFGGLVATSPGLGIDAADLEPFSFTAATTKQWVVSGYNAGDLAGNLEAIVYCR